MENQKKPPDKPLQRGTTGPSAPARPASPDNRPHQSIRNSDFVFHESEIKAQVTSNPQANERPPDSLSTIGHNLSTDGRENRAPVSRESSLGKPISFRNPPINAYRPRLKRQISPESSDDGVQDVPADVLSSLDLSVAERMTASSSGKPISPHTFDTAATPSRLRSDDDIDHGVDRAPQYRRSNRQAPEDLVDGEQRRTEISPPPPGAGPPPPPPGGAAGGAPADITKTKRLGRGGPADVDAETTLPQKLPAYKSWKPKAKAKAACPSTPESTSTNDDSLPDNLVDLMLRWTNIQRDELDGRSQKRHRDSKDQGPPFEKKQRVDNV
ncbi:hypothetical protein DTO166G4_8855 [Paecilomyces variotii]|nr:hypothetical protein DTO166G4_8855 [Paecilomyces variotii]KAJ9234350.1 hypothetical protein DTO166G5_5156 [Paecilomyces variotii]